jgi:hypothetical protein
MIDFPNHSRSYDPTRRAVRFWGHDSAIEASFFINEDALTRIQPDTRPDESGFLNAFDSNRDLICAAAAKVYVRGSRGSYDLDAANFLNGGTVARWAQRADMPQRQISDRRRWRIISVWLAFERIAGRI